MAVIINKASTKQYSRVITLLDLKNPFGEVHHNLIQTALDYHHIPDHIKLLVKSVYTDFKTSIITNEFCIPFVSIGDGVLQSDCLSPLLLTCNLTRFSSTLNLKNIVNLAFPISHPLVPVRRCRRCHKWSVIRKSAPNQRLL